MDFIVDRKTSDAIKQAINDLMTIKNILAQLDTSCDLMVDVLMAMGRGQIDEDAIEKMVGAHGRLPVWDGDTIGQRLQKASDIIGKCLSQQGVI